MYMCLAIGANSLADRFSATFSTRQQQARRNKRLAVKSRMFNNQLQRFNVHMRRFSIPPNSDILDISH